MYFIIETEEMFFWTYFQVCSFTYVIQLNQSNAIAHQWWHKLTPVEKVTTRKIVILRHKHMPPHNCLLSCVMIWSRITLNLSHTQHTHTHDYAECKNFMCRFYVWCHFTFICWMFFSFLFIVIIISFSCPLCDLRHIMRSESLICVCALAGECVLESWPPQCHKIRQ